MDGIDASEKQDLRTLIVSGGPFSAEQRHAINDYCLESDVEGTGRLLPAMLPHIDLPRALPLLRLWSSTRRPAINRSRHWLRVLAGRPGGGGSRAGGGVMADPFDLERLLVNPADLQRKPKRKKWRRQYVQVPWTWVERLQSAKRISTYRLALVLVYESWRLGGRPITLSNVSALAEGLSRRSKWRSLAELEQLGLIEVERHRRHAPRVSLRHLPLGAS